MDHKEEICAAKLTDDLVVDILSRLPFKSFCRFKCVCKSWLTFSSDPHYCQKLPKVPAGFFYQDSGNSTVQLVSRSKNDEGIDGTLSFLPDYEQLNLLTVTMAKSFVSTGATILLQTFFASLCVTRQHESGEYLLILNEVQTTSITKQCFFLMKQEGVPY